MTWVWLLLWLLTLLALAWSLWQQRRQGQQIQGTAALLRDFVNAVSPVLHEIRNAQAGLPADLEATFRHQALPTPPTGAFLPRDDNAAAIEREARVAEDGWVGSGGLIRPLPAPSRRSVSRYATGPSTRRARPSGGG